MNRRAFVAGSLGAAALPSAGLTDAAFGGAARDAGGIPRPLVLELRRYRLRFGPAETRFAEHAKGALVPALNRAGVRPVGAFTVALGPDIPTVCLLLAHPSADSVSALDGRLEGDPEYRRAAPFLGLPAADPPYVRVEASLMTTFDLLPGVDAPKGPLAAASRVFELRTYESHSEAAGRKKIEMFEKAGEIEIFRRVGLTPVFFARDLVGPRLPSLTYMLVFADAAAREKSWAAFRDDPEWVRLRSTPGFTNAEIVSNIHTALLRPTDYSQL
jgi:hypothetical protein